MGYGDGVRFNDPSRDVCSRKSHRRLEATRNTFGNVTGEDALDCASSVIVPFVSAPKVVPDFSLSSGVSRKVVFDLEDGENEAQNTQMKKPLLKPSAEEIRKHNLTHLPFRSWCPICVAARARDDPPPLHRR